VQKDSLLLFSRLTHTFDGHLDACQWKQADDVMRILVGQLGYWLTGVYGGDYANVCEMLVNPE
jgi:hypothetical protein